MDKKIIVKSQEPTRLDRYLRKYYPNITQGVLEKLLRRGSLKLNGDKTKSNIRVVSGDTITSEGANIEKHRGSNNIQESFSQNTISLANKLLSDYLLLFSNDFIAIDKPSGIAVQGGSKILISIDDALRFINSTKDTDYKLVHRLDKETSGVLLVANGNYSAMKLGKAFQNNLIKKTYLAILCGCPKKPEGMLINKIGKDRSGIFEIVKELEIDGKIAKTYYKVLKVAKGLSLVEFHPATGRMHQLRFHSKLLKCPIVGDEKYGGKKHVRMMLHAKSIKIDADIFGKEIRIESKLPEEWLID